MLNSDFRQFIHSIRTPLTTLELNIEHAELLSNNNELKQTLDTAKKQIKKIEESIQKTLHTSASSMEIFPGPETRTRANIPYCYFPATIVLIDDDKDFLNQMRKIFTQKQRVLECYSSPIEALENLSICRTLPDLKDFIDVPNLADNVETNTYLSQFNIKSLEQLLNDPDRFQRVSVAVIDYHMLECDGLAVCKKLSGRNIKIILITGDDDYAMAVDAFNAGLIDQFILKGQSNFSEKLMKMIVELEYQSFVNITQIAYEKLGKTQNTAWNDPVYQAFIKDWIVQQQLQEYVWLNSHGSLLGLTMDGNTVACITRTESDLNEFEIIAAEQGVTQRLHETLKQRKKMVILLTGEEHHLPASAWEEHLYPACSLTGRNQYYYTILNDKQLDRLLPKCVSPYRAYLHKLSEN